MKQILASGALAMLGVPALAAPSASPSKASAADDGKDWPEAWFEIFKLAPGQHEAFIRYIAEGDEVLAAGGQPPITLYFHEGGDEWDVLLLKPEPAPGKAPTAAQKAAMDGKSKELGVESGPAYFIKIRSMIASHTDTKTQGPVSAAQWLARLDGWRAAHPERAGR